MSMTPEEGRLFLDLLPKAVEAILEAAGLIGPFNRARDWTMLDIETDDCLALRISSSDDDETRTIYVPFDALTDPDWLVRHQEAERVRLEAVEIKKGQERAARQAAEMKAKLDTYHRLESELIAYGVLKPGH